jgi:hypothetical protein
MATGAARQAKYFNKLKQAAAEAAALRRRIAELEKAQPLAKSRRERSRARPSNAQRDTL